MYRKNRIICPECLKTKPAHHHPDQLPRLQTFGERFRYCREQAHLRRENIAAEAGIDKDLLSYIETGQATPFRIAETSIERLIDVLRAHKVPVNRGWLLDLPQQGITLATRFRERMEQCHVSEASLADRARVPISQIRLILSGSIASHHKLSDLARVMRTTAEELSGLPPAPVIPKDATAPETIADRLKNARAAKGMSQVELSLQIYQHGTQWSQRTIEGMISRLERGVQVVGEIVLLNVAADVLDVRPDWLMAKSDDPIPQYPLPEMSRLTLTEANHLREQIAQAESDLQSIRGLVTETETHIQALRERLEGTISPQAVAAVVSEPPPVEAPTAINGHANGHSHTNGVSSIAPVTQSFIDRGSDSKQNRFARGLIQTKTKVDRLTIQVVEDQMKGVLEQVLPPGTDRRSYLHALLRRETLADNGILYKKGRGTWSFRDDATI